MQTKSWQVGLSTVLGVEFAQYWTNSPSMFRHMTYFLVPLMLVDGFSSLLAVLLARLTRRADKPFETDRDDSWLKCSWMFITTLMLVVVCSAVDRISGLGYTAVLGALGWGLAGHGKSTISSLTRMARFWGFKIPLIPEKYLDALSAPSEAISKPMKAKS